MSDTPLMAGGMKLAGTNRRLGGGAGERVGRPGRQGWPVRDGSSAYRIPQAPSAASPKSESRPPAGHIGGHWLDVHYREGTKEGRRLDDPDDLQAIPQVNRQWRSYAHSASTSALRTSGPRASPGHRTHPALSAGAVAHSSAPVSCRGSGRAGEICSLGARAAYHPRARCTRARTPCPWPRA